MKSGTTFRQAITLVFDAALVDRTLKMVNTNEYKRNQFCPIIRISPKALSNKSLFYLFKLLRRQETTKDPRFNVSP